MWSECLDSFIRFTRLHKLKGSAQYSVSAGLQEHDSFAINNSMSRWVVLFFSETALSKSDRICAYSFLKTVVYLIKKL